MTDVGTSGPSEGALLWGLYRSEKSTPSPTSREHDGLYLGMLKDDLQKQRYAYEVSLVAQGAEWTRASQVITTLLSNFNRAGYHNHLAELVLDFAGSLLDESVDEEEMLLALQASPAEDDPARGTRRRSKLPKVAAGSGGTPAVLPHSRRRTVGLRKENKRRWTQTVRSLRQVDAIDMGGNDLARLSWPGYEFSEQLAVQNLTLAAATAPIGWDARGAFSDSVTSPYLTFRRLRFIRFWIEAIDDSVAFLNQVTNDEQLYGADAFTFSLSGLPSPKDLMEAMKSIRNGSLTVEEANNTYVSPRYTKRRTEQSDGE